MINETCTPVAQLAKNLRADLRARGYNSKLVGVRSKAHTGGSSIYVEIKREEVNVDAVLILASRYQDNKRGLSVLISIEKAATLRRENLILPLVEAIEAGGRGSYGSCVFYGEDGGITVKDVVLGHSFNYQRASEVARYISRKLVGVTDEDVAADEVEAKAYLRQMLAA